nr:SMC family ATPase [Propionibacterium sp.]
MQVVRLEFQGIGPFTGRHSIDVRALSEGGLFLLEGPTGAGKTTIIDAIVFALYGDVAGVDSHKGRLVSTQLPPGVEPYVDLVVETSRGLLRVRRVPQHERRKTRGSGTTVGRAAIQLWRLASPDDPGTLWSTSMQDANEELQRAIGLTKEQFTQTVVLPQGHFATFLRAKPEERRGVLQDIFGTEFYERCARQLTALAAEHRSRDEEARGALARAVGSFATVAWPDADARAAFEAADPAGTPALARARVAELADLAATAEAEAAQAAAVAAEAGEALRAVEGHNALVAERLGLLDRLAALHDEAGAVAAAEARLGAAERAERARHQLEAVARARVALDRARAAEARGLAELADGLDADLAALADPEALAAAERAAREGCSALVAVVELEEGLAGRAESLRLDAERLAEQRAAGERDRELVGAARARAADLGPELDALLVVAQTRADRIVAEAAAQARCEAVRRLESIAEDFVQARGAEAAARAAAEEAGRVHRVAGSAWLDGLAGTLAAELVDGRGCPVCGATSHPAPARPPEGGVDRATVDRLDAAARRAEQALVRAQATSDGLATAMADQQAAVGTLTRVEAEAALAAAIEERLAAERAAARAVDVREEVRRLVAGADARERAWHERERGLVAEQATLAVRAERLDADRRRVADELAGHASVADRSAALARRAVRAQRLATLRREAADAENQLAGRVAELAEVLAEEGFARPGDAESALLPAPERQRLADLVSAHRTQWATVTERLADARLAAVAGAEPLDATPARLRASAADEALRAAQRAHGAAAETLRCATDACAELIRRARAAEEVSGLAEPYLRLAELANGTGANQAAVTLPTFVLLRRFEEVVDLANVRLQAMTGGRFSLRRTDAREGRSQKLGLGLEVVDHASGDAARDPKTLSGGETFQASLAMALGLADAVTAEAGGVELNTLFVDEGFGSLDPEALDEVMGQLSALRDGGRCVGIVSHVAELKQRIAERITVVRRADGTSTLSCSTDPAQPLAG